MQEKNMLVETFTTTIESFWALLEHCIFGIYSQVSPKYLDRYVDEFEYRFNSEDIKDTDRFNAMFKLVDGRLTYKYLISK